MVRNALRKELTELLATPQGCRRPVIRRSLQERWLYVTDLPLLCDEHVPDDVFQALTGAGWEFSGSVLVPFSTASISSKKTL